jgi:hypothetical protein
MPQGTVNAGIKVGMSKIPSMILMFRKEPYMISNTGCEIETVKESYGKDVPDEHKLVIAMCQTRLVRLGDEVDNLQRISD